MADFARFVGATTPSARLKAVRDAKLEYEPAFDFYRGLRKAIVLGHSNGNLVDAIDEAIEGAHPRRQAAYAECGRSYLRFAGRKSFEFERRVRGWRWSEGDLAVRVNPEIAAWIRGEPHVLKLWFSKPPGRQGERVLLHLLRRGTPADHEVALMFIRTRKIVPLGQPITQAEAFLGSEADAFLGAWRRLGG